MPKVFIGEIKKNTKLPKAALLISMPGHKRYIRIHFPEENSDEPYTRLAAGTITHPLLLKKKSPKKNLAPRLSVHTRGSSVTVVPAGTCNVVSYMWKKKGPSKAIRLERIQMSNCSVKPATLPGQFFSATQGRALKTRIHIRFFLRTSQTSRGDVHPPKKKFPMR